MNVALVPIPELNGERAARADCGCYVRLDFINPGQITFCDHHRTEEPDPLWAESLRARANHLYLPESGKPLIRK